MRFADILKIFTAATLGAAMLCAVGCTPKDNPGENPVIPEPIHEEYPLYDGPYGKTIATAASQANGVNGYFKDMSHYLIENANMRLTYDLQSGDGFIGVESITNLKGGVYIENTMETFIETEQGTIATDNASIARANLYDLGYYYYGLHILDQTFSTSGDNYSLKTPVKMDKINGFSDYEPQKIDADGNLVLKVKQAKDPYIGFEQPAKSLPVSDYDGFSITLKTKSSNSAQIYYIAGKQTSYNGESMLGFSLINDGNFHTYTVLFNTADANLNGYIKGVRLDVGSIEGEEIVVSDFSLIKLNDSLPSLKVDRQYNVFTDKMNETVRIIATAEYTGLAYFGTYTRIPAANVEKILINDKNGNHDTLDGIDVETTGYIGFDIKGVGVFGIILENDPTSGTMSISLEDGYYVVTQKVPVEKNKLKKNGEAFMTRRVYTDGEHDFGKFGQAAYEERNPLTSVTVENEKSKITYFAGYDVLTGAYKFFIKESRGFDDCYENPLAEHKITVSIDGESNDRQIYVLGSADGSLECAVVLDENDQLLPVKVEVCKNFAHDGEELFYTYNDSIDYGLSIFPLVVEGGKTTKFTLCNLYENWGNYRLKQISSIRFHTAYYHMSLGVTETNCISLYVDTTRLPDHRGLSAKYWTDSLIDVIDANGKPTGEKRPYGKQPQHSNEGAHVFLNYRTEDDTYVVYDNVGATKIDGSGPLLTDLTLNYISEDGKVSESYRHVEMPSTDENRAFYEVEYVFNSDVKIENVYTDFSLYKVTAGPFNKFGYLNAANESVIVPANTDSTKVYKLGSDHPYFDYFDKVDPFPAVVGENDVYSCTSFILVSSDIVLNGKQYDGGFVAVEGNATTSFTLDIDGAYTFKKGDKIKLLFILLPWGSDESTDDINVRNVRINTAVNPVVISAGTGSIIADNIVPKVKSEDGATVEFTLSGGYANVRDLPSYAGEGYSSYKVKYERDYNVTVEAHGFAKNTAPKIFELVNGEWQEYNVASKLGYDGYYVSYESDGTFTYSFAVTMTSAAARTFKVVAE